MQTLSICFLIHCIHFFFLYFLAHKDDDKDDFEEVVEELKKHTLEAMQPEMAPWAKEYTPALDDIEAKITITRLQNTETKRQRTAVKYNQLFNDKETKVLVKGGSGAGKTMLSKKISYDWAKGIFTTFYVVFVIFLDMIDSFTSLEDVIVQHYHTKDIQKQRLSDMCEKLGKKCLIVLDGVSENLSHILSKIPWSKFNFLVTSGHLGNNGIETWFSSVCEIQGFTRTEAESLIVKHKSKLSVILDCKPLVPATFSTLENYNPMLVMFLCVLDDREYLSVDKSKINLCELFIKLITMLCKEAKQELGDIVMSAGKLAYDTLHLERC